MEGTRLGRLAGRLLAALTVAGLLGTGVVGAAPVVIDDVRMEVVTEHGWAEADEVKAVLSARFAEEAARGEGRTEILSVHKPLADDSIVIAQVYDYAAEQGFDVTYDKAGVELSRVPVDLVMRLGEGEAAKAAAIVAAHPKFSELIRSGKGHVEDAMPPITLDPATGKRLINQVVMGFGETGELDVHEIVSVSLGDGLVRFWEAGAPAGAVAQPRGSCGPPSSSCTTCGDVSCPSVSVNVSWPESDPVWEMNVIRPYRSRGIYGSNGSGIVFRNVRYKGRLIFDVIHMPVINVKYETGCGQFRDWLWAENCFRATGTALDTGYIFNEALDAKTICEDLSDSGSFKGVAIGLQNNELEFHTEMSAGWYRYHMYYTFTLDGEIRPRFGFGTVSSGCVCNNRFHHVYWRFEVALDGTTGNYATGLVNSFKKTGLGADDYSLVEFEEQGNRTLDPMSENSWKFVNPDSGLTLVVSPGSKDETSGNDTYGRLDYAVLAFNQNAGNANEANDVSPGSPDSTAIGLTPYINGERLGPHGQGGPEKRTVFWYHGEFDRDVVGFSPDQCGYVGPTLRIEGFASSDGFVIH